MDGPPLWTSITTSGSSVITASPSDSDLSENPGPLVLVTARAPPNAAPITEPIAPISSSAWKVSTSKLLNRASSWRMSLAGVIG